MVRLSVLPVDSDEILINQAQRGDLTAFNTLIQRHSHKVHRLISCYLEDKTSVNDLVQEVLLKIVRYLPRFKQKSQFSTWIYRVTLNTVKNYLRALHLRLTSEDQFARESIFVATSPESYILFNEYTNRVAHALAQLPRNLRQCYGYYVFKGQSYEVIAEKMRCPIGTVRSRIFRARQQLLDFMR